MNFLTESMRQISMVKDPILSHAATERKHYGLLGPVSTKPSERTNVGSIIFNPKKIIYFPTWIMVPKYLQNQAYCLLGDLFKQQHDKFVFVIDSDDNVLMVCLLGTHTEYDEIKHACLHRMVQTDNRLASEVWSQFFEDYFDVERTEDCKACLVMFGSNNCFFEKTLKIPNYYLDFYSKRGKSLDDTLIPILKDECNIEQAWGFRDENRKMCVTIHRFKKCMTLQNLKYGMLSKKQKVNMTKKRAKHTKKRAKQHVKANPSDELETSSNSYDCQKCNTSIDLENLQCFPCSNENCETRYELCMECFNDLTDADSLYCKICSN
jgi:hypothetical protein